MNCNNCVKIQHVQDIHKSPLQIAINSQNDCVKVIFHRMARVIFKGMVKITKTILAHTIL